MLLLLFLLSLFQHLRSAPIVTTSNDIEANNELFRASDELTRTLGRREVSQIVTSCIATIFACTWTAIHPGIPHFGQSRAGFIYKRLNITGYALLCPELILFWALQEQTTAKSLTKHFNENFARDGGSQCPSVTSQSSNITDSPVSLHSTKGGVSEARLLTSILLERVRAVPRMISGLGKAIREYPYQATEVIRWWLFGPILLPSPQEGEVLPWTTTHGFFLEMGGFVLCKDGRRPAHTLSGKEFFDLINNKDIDIPSITEDDIRDRCKGDYLTKGATVIQTTWFVFQCASRWSAGLPVTELEVTTLGFAMLNSITYALWWDKPQNIGIPIYLNAKRAGDRVDVGLSALNSGTVQHSLNTPTGSEGTSNVDAEDSALGLFSHIFPQQSPARKFFMQHHWREHNNPLFIFLHLHYNLIRSVLIHDSSLIEEHPKRFIFGVFVGFLFGLVHLIPSLLHGLTLTSRFMWLWRGSAIAMIVIPLIYPVLMHIFEADVFTSEFDDEKSTTSKQEQRAMRALAMVIIFCVYFKLASRPIIAFLALESLRLLPPEALQTVSWVFLIPHV